MIYEKVLFIGPDYRKHTGGIGAVLEVYSKNIEPFNFIASYNGNFNFRANLILFFLSLIKLCGKLIFDRKIKVVHIHGASYGSFYRKLVLFHISKYVFRKKVIYHVHGAEYKLFYDNSNVILKRIISAVINNSDMIICLSKMWKSFFLDNFRAKNVCIINNPIEPVDSKNSFAGGKIRFLFLGRIGYRKGIFDLLEVISENRKEYVNRILLKVGGDGDSDSLKRFILDNNIDDIVQYEGWITGLRKNELLSSSHIYILPSYNEGLPVSLLEAMNYGLAIIATGVGGIPEIVENRRNGCLIHPGNKIEIKKSIDFFLEHSLAIAEMGAASKSMVKQYEISSVIIKLEDVYKSLINL